MLAVSKHEKKAYYSLGKTGTTTLISVLPDEDWYKTGEFSADFMTKIFPIPYIGWKKGYVLQYESLKTLYLNNYEITVIVRQPWKRYVSGMKEILQDYSQNLMSSKELFGIFEDKERLVKIIDRMFYLSEFQRQKDFDFDKNFPYPSDFAIHHNYHTRNWLHELIDMQDRIIFLDSSNLTNHIKNDLQLQLTQNQNVSNPNNINLLEDAIKSTNIYFYIEEYLRSEINLYNTFTR